MHWPWLPLPLLVLIACDRSDPADGSGPLELPPSVAPIAIDGLFDDWDDVPLVFTDPPGDAGATGIDIGEVRAANDEQYLYLSIDLGNETRLGEGNALTLYLDTDGDPGTGDLAHGIGADLVWIFGERYGTFHGQGGPVEVAWSAIRYRSEPTVSADRFELAIGRHERPDGQTALVRSDSIGIALQDRTEGDSVIFDGDIAPDEGSVLSYTFDETPLPPSDPRPTGRTDPEALRLVTWNVLWDGPTDPTRETEFWRIAAALDPDILCLQEVTDHEAVIERAQERLPAVDGGWHSVGWSDRLTLSRYPFAADWPPHYDVIDSRFTVAAVDLPDGTRLAVFNTHMSCCEYEEDRQQEADSFAAYLHGILDPENELALPEGTPMVLVGDTNLVQGSQPLTTLLTGQIVNEGTYGPAGPLDWDATDLADLVSHQTERRMAYTWRVDYGWYWPGRLDYVIYTDSVLDVVHSYILHTGEMSEDVLQELGLEAGDSATASDHLPHVADVVPYAR
jgi:endonuclease/exonuclease/phosphatase family metal-dependent hydrolase